MAAASSGLDAFAGPARTRGQRDGQLALFGLLGSQDKQLIGYAGPHAETKPAAITLWRDFIVGHLVPSA